MARDRRTYSPEPMDDEALAAYVRQQIDNGMNQEDGEVSDERVDVLDRYRGKRDGRERPGHSQVTTREVFETVEWIMPSVMRAFATGSRFVEFDPSGPEDEERAEEETDAVNHLLMAKNDGYSTLYCWLKEALYHPNSYCEVRVEERERLVRKRYSGLTDGQYTQVLDRDGGVNVVEHEETEEVVEVDGVFQPITHHSCLIEYEETTRTLVWENVPPNDMVVDAESSTWNLDDAWFVARRRDLPLSDLIEMGLEPEEIMAAGDLDEQSWQDEEVARKDRTDENPNQSREREDSMQLFTVYFWHARVDRDGDGLAERLSGLLIGNTVFDVEHDDTQPYVSLSSLLMPHQHIGISPGEAVADLQDIMTSLKRQLMDNVYRHNTGRTWLNVDAEVEDTMDNLLDVTAEVVPVRGDPRLSHAKEQITPITQDLLAVMQYEDAARATRSGVTPQSSLNPEVVRQSTEGAFTQMLDEAAQRIELIVRTFGETGVKQLVRKAHHLTRARLGSSIFFKLRGRYIETDPREWREREELTCKVGLGHNSEQRRLQLLQGVLATQQQVSGMGLAEPKHIHATLDEIIEVTNLGETDKYFTPVQQIKPPAPPPPDPQIVVAELNAKLEMARQQRQETRDQRDDQFRAIELQMKQRDQQFEQQMKQFQAVTERMAAGIDALVKRAQAAEISEKARALDMENDATESGVTELLEGMGQVANSGS